MKPGARAFAVLAVLLLPVSQGRACPGDCNGDNRVAVAELILGVRIALRQAATASCPAFDVDRSGAVVVAELIAAVRAAVAAARRAWRSTRRVGMRRATHRVRWPSPISTATVGPILLPRTISPTTCPSCSMTAPDSFSRKRLSRSGRSRSALPWPTSTAMASPTSPPPTADRATSRSSSAAAMAPSRRAALSRRRGSAQHPGGGHRYERDDRPDHRRARQRGNPHALWPRRRRVRSAVIGAASGPGGLRWEMSPGTRFRIW